MGGSGGGYFSGNWRPEELAQRAREAEELARTEEHETKIATLLGSLLSQYNRRDVDGTRRLFDRIVDDLADRIEGVEQMLFGGSVSRHTYVNGLSDVDALVLFDQGELQGKGPRELKALLADCLRDRYGAAAVKVGTLSATLTVGDIPVQILPALRAGSGFRIASGDGVTWATIAPRKFAAALTRHNDRLRGKLVPCIKLVKAIVASHPERRRPSGYHVEALAIDVFRRYAGPRTTTAMVRFFFERARGHVLQPIKDSSGQSVHVDEYLGPVGSIDRRIMGDALDRIGRRIRNADGAASIQRWRELFER